MAHHRFDLRPTDFDDALSALKRLECVTSRQGLHSHLGAQIALIDTVRLGLEQKLVVDILKADLAKVHDVSFEARPVFDLPDGNGVRTMARLSYQTPTSQTSRHFDQAIRTVINLRLEITAAEP